MKSASDNLFLIESSLVDIRSLNTPVMGKVVSSSAKELEGPIWKKGEVVKSWKHRCGGYMADFSFSLSLS